MNKNEFLTKIWDPESFIFASENDQKRPNEWGSGKRKEQKVAWDVANNRYVNGFYANKAFKKVDQMIRKECF